MTAGIRSLLARAGLVELVLAFTLGLALSSLVSALVQGLILSPIRDSHDGGWGQLAFDVDGRTFGFIEIVEATFALAVVAALCVWFSRRAGDRLWDAEPGVECPHCLSEISAAANVCPFCTRDVESGRAR